MFLNAKTYAVFILFFLAGFSSKAQVSSNINWETFLGKHDLRWDNMPKSWQEAPYFGNGFIGSMLYADSTDMHKVILQVFRTDVQDHRPTSSGWTAYSRPRLMIGSFVFQFKGEVKTARLNLSLYNADLRGTVETAAGSLTIHHFVAADKDLIYTEINTIGQENYTVKWMPAEAKTTRKILFPTNKETIEKYAGAYGGKYRNLLKVYEPNPPPQQTENGDVHLSVQNLLHGGQYATAWKILPVLARKKVLVATIQNSYPEKIAGEKGLERLKEVEINSDYTHHKTWWHGFYQKSFLSIPDKKLEQLYWLQLYKYGSATRAGGPIMDTSGPWFQQTPWPYLTWDLNVQLCYWALNTSNHLDVAMSLPNSLNRYAKNLVANVQPESWRKDAAYLPLASAQDLKGMADDDKRYQNLQANLPWAMHNVWLIYRYSMDENFLREKCYPLFKRSMAYYLHLIKKEADGKYHLPLGYSPEYPGKNGFNSGETKDTNIDLALIKWGLQALISSAEILKTDAGLKLKWQEVLRNLADFPVDEKGFKIGAGLSFDLSHRHYSHLLMMYPLYLVNIEQKENRALMERSLANWIGKKELLRGYSFTGAASISAAMRKGDDALGYLRGLYPFLLPNGLYTESGPCFETPLSAAQSIQDMLLQSWGNKIRVFPAVPGEWKDVVFENWLAEGAFEISAKMSGGQTDFISIKSKAGKPCTLITMIKNPVCRINGKTSTLKKTGENSYAINLKKGETAVITSAEYTGTLRIEPVKNE